MATYRLGKDEFVIDDYANTRAFASFLPGIAGLWGIPMWVFYANRGQAIAGFGIQDKDHPIMEFQPANKAYRLVSREGFRTFIKRVSATSQPVVEPFQSPTPYNGSATRARKITQRMRIRMHDLVLEESNPVTGLDVAVHYFTVPHEPFAGLARNLTITNTSRKPQKLQVVDGLPLIIPHGMLDRFLKNMSRTIEAWVAVTNLEGKASFFNLKVEPHDRPEVVPIRAGNYFVGVQQIGQRVVPLTPIIDPAVVFGHALDFGAPERLLGKRFRIPARQLVADKTPCAMVYATLTLRPGESATLNSMFGHADTIEQLKQNLPRIFTPGFFTEKSEQNRKLIEELTEPIRTASGIGVFDQYCRQTYLDNAMRGGVPAFIGKGSNGSVGSRKVVYVYSRKHGDLERDYNYFVVPATHFSQGNANYRDVNQNRRNDPWFYPESGEQNIISFFNLIQADGYNPLVFKGTRYLDGDATGIPAVLREFTSKPFTPGELLRQIERRRLKLSESLPQLLDRVMAASRETEDADHGEGFWTDHWTYNLDLLERYFCLFPDRIRELFIDRRVFTFYDNAHVVASRAKKYRLVHHKIRQYHAIVQDHEKTLLIQSRSEEAHKARTQHGKGAIYTTTLLGKIVCLLANKLASLDPFGVGVEMEAEKPNWFDSLNGLPALLGSSTCETFEIKRWITYVLETLQQIGIEPEYSLALPEEVAELMEVLSKHFASPAQEYWRTSADAKENYRARIRLGFSGNERQLGIADLTAFLQAAREKVDQGLTRAYDKKTGLYRSYYSHEVEEYTTSDDQGIVPVRWKQHALPLFLEGIVHAMRTITDPAQAAAIYRAVKKSPLFDRKLKMYKACESLENEPEEIGRCRVFTPGWLENESVWLHMEYKYLLELLRSGLQAEFHESLQRSLVAFQPAKRYGRSILENSSFIVSSKHPDQTLHGAGFVARLSGATAEFLHIWLGMTVGFKAFSINKQGALELKFSPVLTKEFFTRGGLFEFKFLGKTTVRYIARKRLATFGPGAIVPAGIRLKTADGKTIELSGGIIPEPYAAQVRDGKIAEIEIDLAPRAAGEEMGAKRQRAEPSVSL